MKDGYMIVLISGLHHLPEEEDREAIERALVWMLEQGRKIVFTSQVPVDELDIIDSHLKELISQGLAVYIGEE